MTIDYRSADTGTNEVDFDVLQNIDAINEDSFVITSWIICVSFELDLLLFNPAFTIFATSEPDLVISDHF